MTETGNLTVRIDNIRKHATYFVTISGPLSQNQTIRAVAFKATMFFNNLTPGEYTVHLSYGLLQ